MGPGYGFPWVQFVNAHLPRDEKQLGVRYQHQVLGVLQLEHTIASLNKI